jgi:hypothetical protein
MKLRVVGAGLGRTGTHSLQLALQQLLDAPCYHMLEVFGHPDHIALWHDAVRGKPVDFEYLMAGYRASVDWPACAFWEPLAAANPDAVILLSTRSSADAWWKSANETIFETGRREPPPGEIMLKEHHAMGRDMFNLTFTPDWNDEEKAKAAYEAHNADVRANAPADRLVEWQPGDGWEPICNALSLPVPDEPFPHVNTTDDFRAMLGLDR